MSSVTRVIYSGRVITLTQELVTLPNQQSCELEIIHHPGGVAMVALDAQLNCCLLRQYRHAAGGWLWELPAGKLEKEEAPATTAARELAEEAGMHAQEFIYLGRTISSPGVFTEIIHLYLAQGLSPIAQNHQSDEVIEVHWFPLTTIREWIAQGTIYDAKTIVGITLLDAYLQGKK
jgi:ADP-ribose pyrophosphatase